jgi:sugar-specific transcriptional regulator TrmB
MKQETLEEAADKYVEDFELSFYDTVEEIPVKEIAKKDFIEGAKWQQERMYSEEEVKDMMFEVLNNKREECCITHTKDSIVRKVFKQFKKK